MNEITLNANIRNRTGRSAANTLRRSGRIPGVFYLQNKENILIDVHALELRPLVYTADTHLVSLKLDDGSQRQCIVKDIQFDPVTDRVIHFDLMGLVAGEKIRVEIPIALEGTSVGVREGGLLNHIIQKIEVECIPSQLPDHITVDISDMKIGDMIHVRDLPSENFTYLMEPDAPVVMISHPRAVAAEEAAPVEVAQPTEPELIGRQKPEEE